MIYRTETTARGSRHLDICIDDRAEKIYCEVTLAIYGTMEKSGKYKKWTFQSLKKANEKFNSLEAFIK